MFSEKAYRATKLTISLFLSAILILIMVSPFLNRFSENSFAVLDEILIVITVILGLSRSIIKKRVSDDFLLIVLWVLFFSILSFVLGYSNNAANVVLQAFLHIKLFIFFYLAREWISVSIIKKTFVYMVVLSLLGAFLNIVFPEIFTVAGDRTDYVALTQYFGFNLEAARGFQLNENKLSRVFLLGSIFFIFFSAANTKIRHASIALCVFGLIMTGSKVALGLIILILIGGQLNSIKRNVFFYLIALCIGIGGIYLFYQGLGMLRIEKIGQALTGDSAPIFRVTLMVEGLKLLIENFPFGTGLSTFGTPFAVNEQIYNTTAIAETFFYNRGSALLDNNWASIAGELGVIGIASILYLYRRIIWLRFRSYGYTFNSMFCLFFFIVMFFESALSSGITAVVFAAFYGSMVGQRT